MTEAESQWFSPGERAAFANGFEAGTRRAYEECRNLVCHYRDVSLPHYREHLCMAMHALESLALGRTGVGSHDHD